MFDNIIKPPIELHLKHKIVTFIICLGNLIQLAQSKLKSNFRIRF